MQAIATEFFFLSIVVIFLSTLATSSPQTNLLNTACTGYRAVDPPILLENLNNTFSDIRSQINGSTRFATAQRLGASNPVYALFQCRDYLSVSDCLSCLTAARSQIPKCPTGVDTGARVIYDGCLFRHEAQNFYGQTVSTGNVPICGNETALEKSRFLSVTQQLFADLSIVTPRVKGYFAVTRRGENENMVYGLAQCTHTVSESGCKECWKVAYDKIEACLEYTEGRAVDSGCFMRYSDSAFFSDNFTLNLAPFLRRGEWLKNLTD